VQVSHARDTTVTSTDEAAGPKVPGLLEVLARVPDPRERRGRRYLLTFVLAVAVACALAGARNFREAGDHAADLPQDVLARLGGTPHPLLGRIAAPSETRIRTLIQVIGADLLDDLIGGWLRAQADAGRLDGQLTAIARDGKWLRGVLDASAYQKPLSRVPVTESTPLRNPYWQYSRDKIAGEDLLVAEYRESGFRATIVRPSHTYDATKTVLSGGWTTLARMRAGKPVIVHGDWTSLWTVTHNTDFARGFVSLLGHTRTLGEAFHIASDDVLAWDQIARALGAALGVTPRIVHVPSDVIASADPVWGAGLLGDKAHSMVFDNSKLRSVVPGWRAVIPFERGAREIVDWFPAAPARQVVDERLDAVMDKLAADFGIARGAAD